MKFRKTVHKIIPRSTELLIRKIGYLFFKQISYSQEGEDLILNRIYPNKMSGFYIDVGAHHPIRFSNTYLFYKKGWRGINIDAMPGSMKAFNKIRKRDINLELPISSNSSEIDFYIFNDHALNSFSRELSIKRQGESSIFRIQKIVKLKTYRLEEILDKHLPANCPIDFINIDAEGLDLEVLKSNNWIKYRPRFVLVEILSDNLENIKNDSIYLYLNEQNYMLYAKSVNTCFFRSKI